VRYRRIMRHRGHKKAVIAVAIPFCASFTTCWHGARYIKISDLITSTAAIPRELLAALCTCLSGKATALLLKRLLDPRLHFLRRVSCTIGISTKDIRGGSPGRR
jgi:hypothetical protein